MHLAAATATFCSSNIKSKVATEKTTNATQTSANDNNKSMSG